MSAATGEAPLTQIIRTRIAAEGTAGSDLETALGVVAATGHISAVAYVPDAALNGADTNSRTLEVLNKTATKTAATLALTSGVNLTAFTAKTITLSNTATDYDVTAGDVLSFKSLHVGTGITDPGGVLEVTITRD